MRLVQNCWWRMEEEKSKEEFSGGGDGVNEKGCEGNRVEGKRKWKGLAVFYVFCYII